MSHSTDNIDVKKIRTLLYTFILFPNKTNKNVRYAREYYENI